MIDGKVVRYTAFGTWVYHDDFTARVEELLPTMTDAQLEEIYANHDFEEDPFYELEMPIRCELFTNAVENLIERVTSR